MAIIERIRQTAGNTAQSIAERNRTRREIRQLNDEKQATLDEIERVYGRIGRAYIEAEGQPSEPLRALSRRVAELRARADELEARRLAAQNQRHCPACGAVMPLDSRYCSQCGQKLPEPVAEPIRMADEDEEAPDIDESGLLANEAADI